MLRRGAAEAFLGSVCLGLMLAIAAPAGAAAWYVDDDAPSDPGPGDPTVSDPFEDGTPAHPFDAIQEAIDASVDGDHVVLVGGTYTGVGNRDLDFGGRAITVRGAYDDAVACVIDCEEAGRGFYFHTGEGPASVLQGVTITNGRPTEDSPGEDQGGGVLCEDASPTLVGCILRHNTARDGGGLRCYGGTPTLTDCTLIDNWARSTGGGVSYRAAGDVTLAHCIIRDNWAQDGGGVHCFSGGDLTLTACAIDGNIARSKGGGVLLWFGGDLNATDCTITGNHAYFEYGGGVGVESGQHATFTNTIIAGNSAPSGDGGGLRLATSWTAAIVSCVIAENESGADGGGVWTIGGGRDFANCIMAGNTAYRYGGGMYVSSNATLTNCTVVRNVAQNPLYGSGSGGGVYIAGNETTLTQCTFSGNIGASAGDGLYISSTNLSHATLNGCIFWGNGTEEICNASRATVTYSDVAAGMAGDMNLKLDPLFVDADGPDDDPNTWADNDYRLLPGSPCIDAGDNAAVPADAFDVDGDGDITEPVPVDLDGLPRFVDDPFAPDTGAGTPPIVDMGAYEFQGRILGSGDTNCDGATDFFDIDPFVLALTGETPYTARYPACAWLNADANGDGAVDFFDIDPFVALLTQ